MSSVVTLRNRTLGDIEAELGEVIKRRTIDTIFAGNLLREAREHLTTHGEWLPWLEQNFGMSERTARHWMGLSKFVDDNQIGNVADLKCGLATLYLLSARGTENSIKQVLRLARERHVTKDEAVSIVLSGEVARAARMAQQATAKARSEANAARAEATAAKVATRAIRKSGWPNPEWVIRRMAEMNANPALVAQPLAPTPAAPPTTSADALECFDRACAQFIPLMNHSDRVKAFQALMKYTKARAPGDEH